MNRNIEDFPEGWYELYFGDSDHMAETVYLDKDKYFWSFRERGWQRTFFNFKINVRGIYLKEMTNNDVS